MRLSNSYKQNSKDWYAWRDTGIGASEIAVIMGVSPYGTRFELWAQKLKLLAKPEFNPFAAAAMKRGHDLEPVARERFEKLQGKEYPALNCEHQEFNFIRASLDGYNAEENAVLEIKCPGKVDHAAAKKGFVPEKYEIQVQAQLAISGAAFGYYVSFDGKDDLVVIRVEPNPAMQASIIQAVREFWDLIQTKTPPKVDYSDLGSLVSTLVKQVERVNQTIEALKVLNDAFATNKFLGGN